MNGAPRRGPPSLTHLLLEAPRSLFEAASLLPSLPALLQAPRGDGHAVFVLPGFTVDDGATLPLRTFLQHLGYAVQTWNMGANVVLPPEVIDQIVERFDEIPRDGGSKVSLVGQSLGGIYAREVAKRRPDAVRQVICLGSPFHGEAGGHDFRWIHRLMRGYEIPEAGRAALNNCSERPPVPVVAFYSKSDGICAWRACMEDAARGVDNVEIRGSHSGMSTNPGVFWAIADRLAQPEGEWTPFAPHDSVRGWFP